MKNKLNKLVFVLSATISFNVLASDMDLSGLSTNQFGVRDDILNYIYEKIPRKNSAAFKSAITIAQLENTLYYKTTDPIEAGKLVDKIVFANQCLMVQTSKNYEGYDVFEGIQNLMTNSRERKLHIWKMNRKFFAEHQHNPKLLDFSDIEQLCEKGDY